jgi:hypothetical protein
MNLIARRDQDGQKRTVTGSMATAYKDKLIRVHPVRLADETAG